MNHNEYEGCYAGAYERERVVRQAHNGGRPRTRPIDDRPVHDDLSVEEIDRRFQAALAMIRQRRQTSP